MATRKQRTAVVVCAQKKHIKAFECITGGDNIFSFPYHHIIKALSERLSAMCNGDVPGIVPYMLVFSIQVWAHKFKNFLRD